MSISNRDGRNDWDDYRDDDRDGDRDHKRSIVGTNGADVLSGTSGADTIQGRDGNDTIFGLQGNDTIDGGKGNDVVDGGAGNDRLNGGQGDDVLTGGAGNDYLDGGPHGRDTAVYSGNYLDYSITFSAGPADSEGYEITVADNRVGSPDGTDTLRRIEIMKFADGEFRDGQFYPSGPSAHVTAITALSADTGASAGDFVTFQASQTVSGTFSGTLRAGDIIQVSADGSTWVDATVSGSSWSAAGVTLASGTGLLITRTVDIAGHTLAGASHSYILDTAALAPGLSTAFADSGVSATDGITDSTTAMLSGTAEAGATINVYDGATQIGTTTANATTGAWSFYAASLANGTHNFAAAQIDVAGNLSGSSAVSSMTVDTAAMAPTLSASFTDTGVIGDRVTNATSAVLSGTAERGASVQVYDGAALIGTATANATAGAWSYNATGLSEGPHSFTATQTDVAGNLSAPSAARTLTVDTSVATPAITDVLDDVGAILGSVANGGMTDDARPTLRGTADAGSTVTVYDGSTILGTAVADGAGLWTFTPATALAEARYNFTVTASDAAGNASVSSSYDVTVSVTVGNQPPALTGTPAALAEGIEDTPYLVDAADLLAGFTDQDAGDTLSVTSLSADHGTVTNNGDGTYTVAPALNYNGLVTLNYLVTDGHAGYAAGIQSFSLAAENDPAVIGAPPVSAVTEDVSIDGSGNLTAQGIIPITDVDSPATFSTAVLAVGTPLGALTLGTDGSYTYAVADSAVQSLGAGAMAVDTFRVTSADGTFKDLNFTINGANDAAVIGTPSNSALTEDAGTVGGYLSATGAVSITDADAGQAAFSTSVTDVGAPLGTLSLATDGSYIYRVANSAVQYLGAAETVTDTFRISSADGTTKDISFTLNGVNDTPVLTASLTVASYADTEAKDTFDAMTGTLSTGDADAGAAHTYAVSGGVAAAPALLPDYDLAQAGQYGIVYLNSTSGAYTYLPHSAAIDALPDGAVTADTFTLSVSDGMDGTDSKTLTIDLTGANDASVISGVSGPLNYQVGDLPVAVAPVLTLGDADSDLVTSASVVISAGFQTGNDALDFTVPPDSLIEGSYNPATGVLLFTGDGTLAQYQSALDSVHFSTTTAGGRSISFTVFDHEIASITVDTSNVSLDNLTTTGFRLPGEAPIQHDSGSAGFSVGGAGDVNGDGFADLIIGAPFTDPNGNAESGTSYVVFGKPTAFDSVVPLASIGDTNGGFKLTGVAENDSAGFAVSGAGDINGDGISDIIIGATYADPNGTDSGASYVVFGSDAGLPVNLSLASLNGSNGFRISGEAAFDRSGYAVSAAGDVNGDGFGDLLIGATYANTDGVQTGASYVIFGKISFAADLDPYANLDLASLDGTNGFRISGMGDGDRAGDSVSSAGDVNGDGLGDLIIGATRASAGGEFYSGEVYVLFGNTADFGAAVNVSQLDGSNGFRLSGAGEGAQAGYAVSSAGDVNGDGFGDLIIGAPYASTPNGIATGAAYVVFGKQAGFASDVNLSALGDDGFRIIGAQAYDRAAYAVSAAGDVNGDGYADLIVGAPDAKMNGEEAGTSYVVFGKASGLGADIDLSTLGGNDGFRLSGVGPGDDSGYAVGAAGDVNGDGFDDLIVGSAWASPNGVAGAGESYVVFGAKFIVGDNTYLGRTGGGTLQGSAANDTFIGGQGDDTIISGGGVDAFRGGAGNDTLHLGASGNAEAAFVTIHGGSGFDTLALDGSGMVLDLNAPGTGSRVQEIEQIDLTGSGNNTLILNIRDVLNISDTGNRLFVEGNAGDSVISPGQGWALSPGGPVVDHGHTFDSYTLNGAAYSQGMANLLIEQQLTVILS